jgi:hypothetical protein
MRTTLTQRRPSRARRQRDDALGLKPDSCACSPRQTHQSQRVDPALRFRTTMDEMCGELADLRRQGARATKKAVITDQN